MLQIYCQDTFFAGFLFLLYRDVNTMAVLWPCTKPGEWSVMYMCILRGFYDASVSDLNFEMFWPVSIFIFWFPFYYHYFSCPSRGVRYHFLIRSEILLRHICFRLSMFCGQKIYFYYMGISGESGILKHGTFLPETRQTPTGIFMI